MDLRKFTFTALLCVPLSLAACGDGPDDDPAPTAGPSTPAGASGDFGPAPKLEDHVLKISPAHAASVKQATTRSPDPARPSGVCAEVSFIGLEGNETLRWFRFAYDGTEVTGDLTWLVAPASTGDRGGTVCFAPAKGLGVGQHSAAVAVADPANINSPVQQVVAWKFEVTE